MYITNKRVLADARVSKKDEFYTQLKDVENELTHYKDELKGKTIYCNADNPEESMFFHYFVKNFTKLGIKKVISSYYVEKDYNLFNMNDEEEYSYSYVYDGDDMVVNKLNGDGDFRGRESIKLLIESDIVVTNPPFSLFREFISQMVEYEKKFLIIGTNNAITYKDFFELLKENEVWPGTTFNKTMEFEIPDYYDKYDRIDEESGKKYASVPGISWWTNMKHDSQNNKLELVESYSSNKYPTYSNFNAIDVSSVDRIPKDYDGIMGVPITFIGKYNPEQFRIIGLGAGNMYKELNGEVLGEEFVSKYFKCGGKGNYVANQNILGYYDENGVPVIPYMRILIKRA